VTQQHQTVLDLVKRLPNEEQAWTLFFEKMYSRVYALLFALTGGDVESSKDLTQETFLRFITHDAASKVKNDEAAAAYLRAIARNLFRDELRRSFRNRGVSLESMTEEELERAMNGQLRSTIDELDFAIWADLRPEERSLLRLTIRGAGISEVAKELGLTYSAAAVRLHRLKKKLAGK